MALINLESIIAILHTGDVFTRRSDPRYWSGWISGDGRNRQIQVTAAALEESGLEVTIVDGGTSMVLAAVPADASHTHVLLDGDLVEGAAMVFAPKPTLGNMTRFAFDFRPVPLNGNQARINLRYDP